MMTPSCCREGFEIASSGAGGDGKAAFIEHLLCARGRSQPLTRMMLLSPHGTEDTLWVSAIFSLGQMGTRVLWP